MLEVSQVLECKQLHAQGRSIRSIAKELGVSRNTVRDYLRGERRPGEYTLVAGRPRPVSAALDAAVREMLLAERVASTPRKQRLTAARIGRLLAARGLEASESTVRAAVRRVRLDVRDPLEHAFVPLTYAPGEDAQVDFFEGLVDDVEQGRTKTFILLVRACYSGRTFAYAAPNQTRKALFEGLARAFEFFGGVFRRLWFDNLTPAVRKVLEGRRRIEQEAFKRFRAHYGFVAEFCAPAKGNEKGGVEGSVKFARHEILSPIPRVAGRGGVQAHCSAWMERDLSRTIRGRERTIGEHWQEEASRLIALPAARFDAAIPRTAKVSPRSWISIGTIFYSTPVEWVGREVEVKLDAERVIIRGPHGACVEHARSYVRHSVVLDVDHYLPLLRRKHRSLDHALPLQHFLQSASGEWRALLAALRRDTGEIRGAQEFVDVLLLCRAHSIEVVQRAVEAALRHPQVSLGVVRFHVRQQIEQAAPTPETLEYSGPTVKHGSPSDYAVLASEQAVQHG
jgi:transposase